MSPVCCAGAARAAGAAAIAARAHAMAQARLELRISMCTDLPDHQLSVGPIGSAGTVNTEKAARTRHAVGRVRPAGRPARLGLGPRRSHNRRSAEHTSELQSLMRLSYSVFILNK